MSGVYSPDSKLLSLSWRGWLNVIIPSIMITWLNVVIILCNEAAAFP